MKNIFTIISVFLAFLVLGSVSFAEPIKSKSSAKNKQGQVVAYFNQEGGLESSKYAYSYRKYYGKTKGGYYIVQDFYSASDKKGSDPFTVKSKSDFKLGVPQTIEGKYVLWHENGQKQGEVFYKKGQAQGLWVGRHENGKKAAEGYYKDGSLDGFWAYWHENGTKSEEGYYKWSGREGLWKQWHKNGQQRTEGYYKNRQADGVWIYWHENGQKSQEGHYIAGQKNGLWREWNAQGVEQATKNYKDGKIIR